MYVGERIAEGSADEVMRDLQADYWKSEDLKRGLESLAANGPGAARFEGK